MSLTVNMSLGEHIKNVTDIIKKFTGNQRLKFQVHCNEFSFNTLASFDQTNNKHSKSIGSELIKLLFSLIPQNIEHFNQFDMCRRINQFLSFGQNRVREKSTHSNSELELGIWILKIDKQQIKFVACFDFYNFAFA